MKQFLVLLTDTKHSTLEDVRDLLIIVILNSFLTTNIIHLTSALQTFIQLKRSDQLKSLETSLKEHHTSLLTNETKYEEAGVDNPKDIISESNIMSHDSTFDSVNYEDLPWKNKTLHHFFIKCHIISVSGSLPVHSSSDFCIISALFICWESKDLQKDYIDTHHNITKNNIKLLRLNNISKVFLWQTESVTLGRTPWFKPLTRWSKILDIRDSPDRNRTICTITMKKRKVPIKSQFNIWLSHYLSDKDIYKCPH